jgi:hypothetical protein
MRAGTWSLIVAIAVLALLRARMGPMESGARAVSVVPLIDPADSKLFDGALDRPIPVAGLTVTRPGPDGREESYLFARSGGVWRCITHLGLVADRGRIEGLLAAALETEGLPQPAGAADQAGFGLEPRECVRIELHGRELMKREDRDVLFSIDIGRPLGRGGAFARVDGTGGTLLIDTDLAAGLRFDPSLTRTLTGIPTPPLADPHVIPAAWPSLATGIARVEVSHADGTGFVLTRLPDAVGPTAGPNVPRYELRDFDALAPVEAHPALTTGYTLFLARAPYLRPRDPAELGQVGRVATRVTVTGGDGESLQLGILPADFGRTRTVVNSWSGSALEIDSQVAELLAPDPSNLTDPERGIVWDPYLR